MATRKRKPVKHFNPPAGQGYEGRCPVPGCSAVREEGQYFCVGCYRRLPINRKAALWQPTPHAPHQHFRYALAWLIERDVRNTATDAGSLLPGKNGIRYPKVNPSLR